MSRALSRSLRDAVTRLLVDEQGQAMTEYAVTSGAIIIGSTGVLTYFLPAMLDAYQIYITGFYLVLGLPIP